MNNDPDLDDIELIEDSIDGDDSGITRISKTYAEFLLKLLVDGRFDSLIGSGDLNEVRSCLEGARHAIVANEGAECLQKMRILERNSRDANPALSYLARCVIQSYIREKDWDDDTAPDRSPLYLFLIGVRKIIPGIGPEFVAYFKAKL